MPFADLRSVLGIATTINRYLVLGIQSSKEFRVPSIYNDMCIIGESSEDIEPAELKS
jgi:hypothetical protein